MIRISGRSPLALLSALLLAVVSCSRDIAAPQSRNGQSLGARSGNPASVISDGARGGNAHFFWLPPLVSAPTYSGESDPDATPTVVVCELRSSGAGCGQVIASFARGGSTADAITYDPTSQQYHVNWKTDQCLDGPCALDPNKTYRLRVLVGSYELGFADVDVVSSASQLRNVATGQYIGLVEGRTLPIKFRVEKGAAAVVKKGEAMKMEVKGGVLATDDGSVALQVPEGALTVEKSITVSSVSEELPGIEAWAEPIDLGPDGTTFEKPVMLTMHFDGRMLPEGIPPSAMRIFTWKGDSWELVKGSVVNEADNTVTAPIEHFSYYYVSVMANRVQGHQTYNSMYVGETTVETAFAYFYEQVPVSRCDQVAYYVYENGSYTIHYTTRCYTTMQTVRSYPVGQRLYWSALDPADQARPASAAHFDAPGYSIIGTNGQTTSPMLHADAPGSALIWPTFGDDENAPYVYSWVMDIFPVPSYTLTFSDGNPATGVRQLIVQQSDGSGRRVLASFTNDGLGLLPRFSRDGNQIVFSVGGQQESDLYLISNVNGVPAMRRVTDWPGLEAGATFTPGARSIFFTGTRSGNYELWSIDNDPANPNPGLLTHTAPEEGNVSVSPDGLRMAFARGNGSGRDIIVRSLQADANGNFAEIQVTDAGGISAFPRWSPDGSQLLIERENALYFISSTRERQTLADMRGVSTHGLVPSGADLSPDGKKIVFVAEGLWDVYIMNADGTGLEKVPTPDGLQENYPSFKGSW